MSTTIEAESPWSIDASDFYELETRSDQMRFLLRYAILAPSPRNRQPWLFKIVDEGIEVFADQERRLPISDPQERELYLSLGGTITNLRVAAAHFGFETTVLYENRAEQSLPVATIACLETCGGDRKLARLFPAIRRRRTDRRPFRSAIDWQAVQSIADLLEENPDAATVLPMTQRQHVKDLIAAAQRATMDSKAYRQELADSIRTSKDQKDGLSAESFAVPQMFAGLLADVIRKVDVGPAAAERDRRLVEDSAALIAVTADDDRVSLLRAGEFLELLLLHLTLLDVHYSFLNQVIEVPESRAQLQELLRSAKPPQLLLRIGCIEGEEEATPRRPLESVLIPS